MHFSTADLSGRPPSTSRGAWFTMRRVCARSRPRQAAGAWPPSRNSGADKTASGTPGRSPPPPRLAPRCCGGARGRQGIDEGLDLRAQDGTLAPSPSLWSLLLPAPRSGKAAARSGASDAPSPHARRGAARRDRVGRRTPNRTEVRIARFWRASLAHIPRGVRAPACRRLPPGRVVERTGRCLRGRVRRAHAA